MDNPIPIVWGYSYETIIGNATLRDDGKLELIIEDPELIRRVKRDQEVELKAISISHTPSVPTNQIPKPNLTFSNREDAQFVLTCLTDILIQYKSVSKGDLYELVGIPTTYIHQKQGWTSLMGSSIRQIGTSYELQLPPIKEL